MAQPTTKTIKQLFAVSGNQCAFPSCTAPLVDLASGTTLGEICHIKAQSPDGPRYDPDQDEKARHGFKNLLLLCPAHHKIIDNNPATYPVQRLLEIKAKHEAQHTGGSEPSDDVARQFLIRVVHEFTTTPTSLHQLPPPPGDFTGRKAELATLTAAVESGGAVICGLRGMGGVGKTVLALKLAQQLTPRYPDAQFYLDLQGTTQPLTQPLTPAEAMTHVIRAYHPAAQLPESEAELGALYRSVLHGQRAILLMDDAANCDQVKPLLPPSPCLLIVTSRRNFTLPGLRSLDLDKLPALNARALLLKIAPRLQSGSADDCANGYTAEIAKLCGYLPLALRLAGSALAERIDIDPADYLEQLRDTQTRLSLVDASLKLSYNLLGTKLQRLWCLLSVFPATFDRAAVSAVWKMDDASTRDPLSRLLSYSLVEWNPETSRYSLHDLARLFANARLGADGRDTAQQRHAAYYEAVLRAANELYKQGGESIKRGLALFDLEWPNIQAGQAWGAGHYQEDDTAAQLCSDYPDAGAHCIDLRLHSRERIRWLETALDAARKLGQHAAEGIRLGNLGTAYSDLGQMEKAIAHYEQSLVIAREIGDHRAEGASLSNLGNAYSDLGQVEKAIQYYEQGLIITQEVGDRQAEGTDLGNLGTAYYVLGKARRGTARRGMARRAIAHHERALVIAHEIGDRRGEGEHLGNLGLAYRALGLVGEAMKHCREALAIAREIGDRRGEGTHSWNLGLLYEESDPAQAAKLMQVLVDYKREIGHPDAETDAARVQSLLARLTK